MIRTRANPSVWVAALVGLFLCLSAGVASAEQVHYIGVHPIADAEAEAFCYIEVPHVHVYKPAPKHVKVLYRVEDDTHHFVGDPVGFGYEGDKHPYYGHHPISVHVDVAAHVDVVPDGYDDEYCYIGGAHYHHYAPPPSLRFVFKGNAYWYVGKFPPAYRKRKKVLVGINAVYRPLVYERPVVVVEARPPEYIGPIVAVEAAAPDVIVAPPAASVRAGVEIEVPMPTVEVDVGIGVGVPGVIVVDKHRHKRHRKHKKHKKFKKFKKHKKKGKGRRNIRWR